MYSKIAIVAEHDGRVLRTTEAKTADLALACAIIVVDPFVQVGLKKR